MTNTIHEIRNEQGERLDFSLDSAPSRQHEGLVVIGHGVTANKDRPWALALAAMLNDAGFDTLRFSFSGNGDSEGRFEDSTISKEVADLGSVLDQCASNLGRDAAITYVGHSMGAAVGVLRAATDSRIVRLVSLGGMVHTASFAERKFGDLTPGQDRMWDKPECPLSQDYMDDLRQIDSVLESAGAITVPFLLVHGDADSVVPPSESLDVLARSRELGRTDTQQVTLQDADHVFTADAAPRMAAAVRDWLRQIT